MTMTPQDETKREVWDTLRKLNDCWTKADGKELVHYFHKYMVAITPTDRLRREGRDACVAGWVAFAKYAKIHHWQEIDPRIQIFGDTAIVTYYFDMSFDMGGQTIQMGGRDMFTFVKEAGKWWAVANQFSPYPQG
jgi:hypothetical protein